MQHAAWARTVGRSVSLLREVLKTLIVPIGETSCMDSPAASPLDEAGAPGSDASSAFDRLAERIYSRSATTLFLAIAGTAVAAAALQLPHPHSSYPTWCEN
jgi:hypothetical protein